MRRIFLDTNIYIIGQLKPLSPQERIRNRSGGGVVRRTVVLTL